MRHGNRTTAWVHAWRQFFAKCTNHDQHCAYDLMRDEPGDGRDANDPRLHTGWKGQLWMGVMPPRCGTSGAGLCCCPCWRACWRHLAAAAQDNTCPPPTPPPIFRV